ncbi:MAG: hypothetical protein KatS3mg091_027 [Patescibacteria group bacterium]|nr:MAG: hypothetical protein KatS3mg091_027 [Patescibacteria group bacterium]
MEFKNKVKVITRNVKYIRFEVKNFQIRLILPPSHLHKVSEILETKRGWLKKQLNLIESIKEKTKKIKTEPKTGYKTLVNQFIEKYCKKIKKYPKTISYKTMKNCWGLCSSTGIIKFNEKIKYLTKDLIEYIVCHEVCHLKIHNHSKDFRNLLNKLYGQEKAKKARSELRLYEYLLLKA